MRRLIFLPFSRPNAGEPLGPASDSAQQTAYSTRWLRSAATLATAAICTVSVLAQTSSQPEWTTSSYNQLRDAWQRNETKLTPQNAGQVKLLWKIKVDNKTMGMQSFREPLIVNGIQTKDGVKTLALVAGSRDQVFAIDVDSGQPVWEKKLKWASNQAQENGEGRGFICTNALSANPVITPAGQGERTLYVMTPDGYLRFLDPSTGDEKQDPVQVLAGVYGKPYGLNLVDDVVYTITGQGCGGVANALYAYNIKTKKVTQSQPPQGGLWGTAGPAVGNNGMIYFSSGDHPYDPAKGLLATTFQAYTFANDTLTLKDYFTPSNWKWLTQRDLDINSSQVVFDYKGRDIAVGGGKEGRFYLMDSNSMGGANHMTPLFRSELIANANVNFQTEGQWGSYAAWKDAKGTQWVLAPNGGPTTFKFPTNYGDTPNGGVLAFKVEEKNGKTVMTPVWQSVDMTTAEPPVVANGLVIEVAGGEFTGQTNDTEGGLYGAEDRIKRSVPAKLFLLDAVTGKELYSSGDQITSFLHQAGPSIANGKIVFGSFDGTIYCFGIK